MSAFHTVRFTTQVNSTIYDTKGKVVSVDASEKEVVITCLPYATAMSYSKCDNFTIEPYVFEDRRAASKDKNAWAMPATKKVPFNGAIPTQRASKPATVAPAVSKTATAARTGNLAAAVSNV